MKTNVVFNYLRAYPTLYRNTMQTFLKTGGGYRNLKVYLLSEIIYDITFYFTSHYLPKGDRTVDQMIQASRSGKQNIAEGSAASTTSKALKSC